MPAGDIDEIDAQRLVADLVSARDAFLRAAEAVAEGELALEIGHAYSVATYILVLGASHRYDDDDLLEVVKDAAVAALLVRDGLRLSQASAASVEVLGAWLTHKQLRSPI